MANHDDQQNRRAKRIVDETQEQVQATRNRIWEEHLTRGVSLQSRRQLAAVVVEYWDVLKKHRDDNRETWNEYKLDGIRDLALSTTTIQRSAPGDTGATRAVEVPQLVAMDIPELLNLSDRLDDFAKDIGFAPSTKSRRSRYHIQRRSPEDHPEPVNEQVPKPGQ